MAKPQIKGLMMAKKVERTEEMEARFKSRNKNRMAAAKNRRFESLIVIMTSKIGDISLRENLCETSRRMGLRQKYF